MCYGYNDNYLVNKLLESRSSRIDPGAQMLMYGPTHPKRPPHGKEGRCKGTDRSNEGSITLWDRQSQPGVHGRDERGRLSGPVLFISYTCLDTHSSRHAVATHLIEVRNVLSPPEPWSTSLELAIYCTNNTLSELPRVTCTSMLSVLRTD